MAGAFRDLLARLLEEREVPLREYARRCGHKNHGLVALVLKGKRALPLDELDRWASAIRPPLSDDERERFYDAALQEYAPPEWQKLWREAKTRDRRIAALERFFFGAGGELVAEADAQDSEASPEELRRRLVLARNAARILRDRLREAGVEW